MGATDALRSALLQGTNLDNEVAKAEDLATGSGVDWKSIFFEPQPGKDYLIKFLPNIGGNAITHRSQYRSLPDPDRKGKTFRYTSSGKAETCPVLQLFFELHAAAKNGDTIAEKKKKKYLANTNQAACVIQIIESPDKEEVGAFRIWAFSSYGENATIANLLNLKLHPSEKKIKLGETAEDIFNVFGSSAMYVVCKKVSIPQANGTSIEGRGYSESQWMDKKKYGAIVRLESGEIHQFSEADKDENGNLKPEVEPFFNQLIAELQKPNVSIHNNFAYAAPGDPNNTPETEEYLKRVLKKVEEIVPVIREKSIDEIDMYGRGDAASTKDGAKTIGGKNAADILKDSAPSELAGSVMNQDADPAPASKPEAKTESAPADSDSVVDSILGE